MENKRNEFFVCFKANFVQFLVELLKLFQKKIKNLVASFSGIKILYKFKKTKEECTIFSCPCFFQ